MLIVGGFADSMDVSRWIHFQQIVEQRLSWLSRVVGNRARKSRKLDGEGQPMTSVFLCHSSKDKFFVRELGEKLADYGIRVWIDEAELNIGDSLIGKIGNAINEVDYVGVVLSSNSIESEWVQRELNLAIQREFEEMKVVVLPLLLERVVLPPFLKDKLYADFTSSKAYAETFPKLLRALNVSEDEVERVPLPVEDTAEAAKLAPSEQRLASFEDIKILDLDNGRAYKPDPDKNLYYMYFLLSDTPPAEWEEIFDAERRFPRHTMWRRAWIEGAHIVVHCVPDEVEKYHFPDLQQDTANTNSKYRSYLREQAEREIRELMAGQEEAEELDELRMKLGFR